MNPILIIRAPHSSKAVNLPETKKDQLPIIAEHLFKLVMSQPQVQRDLTDEFLYQLNQETGLLYLTNWLKVNDALVEDGIFTLEVMHVEETNPKPQPKIEMLGTYLQSWLNSQAPKQQEHCPCCDASLTSRDATCASCGNSLPEEVLDEIWGEDTLNNLEAKRAYGAYMDDHEVAVRVMQGIVHRLKNRGITVPKKYHDMDAFTNQEDDPDKSDTDYMREFIQYLNELPELDCT